MRAETVLARSAVTVKPVEARFDVLEGRKQLSDVLGVVELTRIRVTAQVAGVEPTVVSPAAILTVCICNAIDEGGYAES